MTQNNQATAPDRLPVTAAAFAELAEERERLHSVKQRELPERLRTAREFGDGASNDEYLAILEEEAIVNARIARLDEVLSRATVVDAAGADDTIGIGSSVVLYDLRTGGTHEYSITGAHAAVGPGAVSAVSPVGAALLGRKPGDVVQVELPRGRSRRLEVLAVRAVAHP